MRSQSILFSAIFVLCFSLTTQAQDSAVSRPAHVQKLYTEAQRHLELLATWEQQPGPKGSEEKEMFEEARKVHEATIALIDNRNTFPSPEAFEQKLSEQGPKNLPVLQEMGMYDFTKRQLQNGGPRLQGIPNMPPVSQASLDRISKTARLQPWMPRWFIIEKVDLYAASTDAQIGESLRKLDEINHQLKQARDAHAVADEGLRNARKRRDTKFEEIDQWYDQERNSLRAKEGPLTGPSEDEIAQLETMSSQADSLTRRAEAPDRSERRKNELLAERDQLLQKMDVLRNQVHPELIKLNEERLDRRSAQDRYVDRYQRDFDQSLKALIRLEDASAEETEKLQALRNRGESWIASVEGTNNSSLHTKAERLDRSDVIRQTRSRIREYEKQLAPTQENLRRARQAHLKAADELQSATEQLDFDNETSSYLQLIPEAISQSFDVIKAAAEKKHGGVITTAAEKMIDNWNNQKFYEAKPGGNLGDVKHWQQYQKQTRDSLAKLMKDGVEREDTYRYATESLRKAIGAGDPSGIGEANRFMEQARKKIEDYSPNNGYRQAAGKMGADFVLDLFKNAGIDALKRSISDYWTKEALERYAVAASRLVDASQLRTRAALLNLALEDALKEEIKRLEREQAAVKAGKIGELKLTQQSVFFGDDTLRFTLTSTDDQLQRALRSHAAELVVKLGEHQLTPVGTDLSFRLNGESIDRLQEGPDQEAWTLTIMILSP